MRTTNAKEDELYALHTKTVDFIEILFLEILNLHSVSITLANYKNNIGGKLSYTRNILRVT